MSIALLILKIIGILLLILLGLILFLLLLVLAVPVRYVVSGEVQEDVKVQIAVSWLLHLVSLRAVYADGELESCLRILGIRRRRRQSEDNLEEAIETELTDEQADEKAHDAAQMPTEKASCFDAGQNTAQGKGHAASKREYENAGWRTKIWKVYVERISRIKNTILQIPDKVSDIKSIIFEETNKIAVVQVLTELRYLLGHFRFRRLETDLQFSLGDPALTGQALGALCVMPFMYRYQVQVYPDFESEKMYLRGTFLVRGRARVIHVVVSLIRLWKNKECRILLRRIMGR